MTQDFAFGRRGAGPRIATQDDEAVMRTTPMKIARIAATLWLTTLFGATLAHAQGPKPELSTVRLAVGGKPALYYLPLTVAERLGYFKDAGLNVEISDFQGGAKSLQALIGGSADVVAGAYDHTIQMQAKGQHIEAVVDLGRFPGFVLAVRTAKAASYHGPKDLKGMKIGVTAPGSSTNFMVLYMMAKAGLKPTDASFIGVGASSSAVAAVKRGDIDALVNTDPVISLLDSEKLIKIVADTRTAEGSKEVYGGPLPAAVLYATPGFIAKNPNTVQALVNAFVRALKWMQTHSPEQIAAVMPEEYALGNKAVYIESIKHSMSMYSPDGHLSAEGGDTAYKVLNQFDPSVQKAKIDVSKTFTNAFVDKAPGK
jgi:NitT/TauT family transport system substrate-binding protein